MEQIKITDKLTLRQEALRMAIESNKGKCNDSICIKNDAYIFESYLRGGVDLPEYVDPEAYTKQWAERLGKLQESCNPKPWGIWIPANSEIKPADDILVLCALLYDSIVYEVMSYSKEHKQWQGGRAEDSANHVVGWMPIPPFAQLHYALTGEELKIEL